jgi:AraC-like DNA-binding protein
MDMQDLRRALTADETVEELDRRVALSRSALATRFGQVLGQSPRVILPCGRCVARTPLRTRGKSSVRPVAAKAATTTPTLLQFTPQRSSPDPY